MSKLTSILVLSLMVTCINMCELEFEPEDIGRDLFLNIYEHTENGIVLTIFDNHIILNYKKGNYKHTPALEHLTYQDTLTNETTRAKTVPEPIKKLLPYIHFDYIFQDPRKVFYDYSHNDYYMTETLYKVSNFLDVKGRDETETFVNIKTLFAFLLHIDDYDIYLPTDEKPKGKKSFEQKITKVNSTKLYVDVKSQQLTYKRSNYYKLDYELIFRPDVTYYNNFGNAKTRLISNYFALNSLLSNTLNEYGVDYKNITCSIGLNGTEITLIIFLGLSIFLNCLLGYFVYLKEYPGYYTYQLYLALVKWQAEDKEKERKRRNAANNV